MLCCTFTITNRNAISIETKYDIDNTVSEGILKYPTAYYLHVFYLPDLY